MVIETPITAYDPRYTLTNYDGKLGKLVAPGLTTVDTPNADAKLLLASKIDTIDPVTIDVTLRDDVVFSDGKPVRAEDVIRTYETVMDAKCGSLYEKRFLERYTSLEKLSDKQVRFHLKKPLGTFFTDIDFGIVSFHGVAPGECRPPKVVGTGPFIVRELDSSHVLLDVNPHFRPAPKVAHVEIKFVRDQSARILMLVGGSVDLIQNAVRLDLVGDVLEQPRVRLDAAPSVLLTYMLLNNADPMLADVRVRRAIALAIDRRAIINAKFGGRALLAASIMPPAHWAFDKDLVPYERDLPRARALLDEAGFKPDRNGIRMRLVYKTSSDQFRVSIARVIASQLADVGIDVELRTFEFATFFADVKKGNYQLATIQSPEITEPDYHHWFFHSSEIPDAKNPDGGNRARFKNADMDRLTEEGRREVDPAKRRPLYLEAQKLVANQLPILPLWHEDNVVLSNVDVQGYTIVANARFIGLVTAFKSP